MYYNKALMGTFGVLLLDVNVDKLNEGLTYVFKQCVEDVSTNSEIVCFT